MNNILLVDDERIIMEGMQNIIKGFDLGFDRFEMVEDGRHALEIIDAFKPEIVITDIRMPYVDGIELVKRIRERNDTLRNVHVILLSGYSDFSYAKCAIKYGVSNYLLKPVNKEELYDTLLKVKQTLSEKQMDSSMEDVFYRGTAITRIQKSKCKNEQAIKEQFLSVNVDVSLYSSFQLTEISFREDAEIRGNAADTLYSGLYPTVIVNSLKDILNDLRESNHHVVGISNHGGKMLVLTGACANAGDSSDLSGIYEKIADRNREVIYGIYVGRAFENISGINDSQNGQNHVAKYKMLLPDKTVITYEDIKNRVKEGPMFLKEIQDIISGIEQGRLQQVIERLNEINHYITGDNSISATYIRNVHKSIFSELRRHFYDLNSFRKSPEVFEVLSAPEEIIDGCKDFHELHAKTRACIINFYETYQTRIKNSKGGGEVTDEAKKIIRESYSSRDFSLQTVAGRLHISDSYLSTIFKKEVGISFNEYLCKIRISRAIELLKDNGIQVSDIGGKIGYSSEKHFFMVFKKYVGMSPAKYRSRYQL